jgi:hypothetical protein
MPALARQASTQHHVHGTAGLERRRFGADRRSTWRGSRRDEDWIAHLEREAAVRRARFAGSASSVPGSDEESPGDTR